MASLVKDIFDKCSSMPQVFICVSHYFVLGMSIQLYLLCVYVGPWSKAANRLVPGKLCESAGSRRFTAVSRPAGFRATLAAGACHCSKLAVIGCCVNATVGFVDKTMLAHCRHIVRSYA